MTPRPALDLRLYLVTDTAQCGRLGVVATVAAAVAGGVTAVQLRDPEAGLGELRDTAMQLTQLLAPSGIPLLINDHPELVAATGAAGVHIGQDDTEPARAREVIGPDRLLGLSVQTPEHVSAALHHGDLIDYLGVGPVWPTGSKPDAAPAGGPASLAEIVHASPWPCVAIGGISRARVAEARHAGAAGVAVISAICGQPDPHQAAADLLAAWETAR